MFENFIVQPIFNLLLYIYSVIPGNDFGVSIILFTLITRFAMWPLLKKQLHQSKVMREMQPFMKKIKKQAKGDRVKESQLMSELYKEKGVNPLSSLFLLFIQIPVFLGLFSALRSLESPARLISMPYSFVQSTESVQEITTTVTDKTQLSINEFKQAGNQTQLDKISQTGLSTVDPINADQLRALSSEDLEYLYNEVLVDEPDTHGNKKMVHGPFFDQHLFMIDLSRSGFESGMPIYWPLIVIALMAGVIQYLQTKQLTAGKAESKERKTIRQILKENTAEGKEPDQAELNAALGSRMTMFFAPMIAYISAISLGGLAVYFLSSGLIGYLQQRTVLKHDVEEMEEIADEPDPIVVKKKATKRNKKKR